MNAYAELSGDVLTLGNDVIEREYLWNGGNLISRALRNKASGREWQLCSEIPDCDFPGENAQATDGALEVEEVAATATAAVHLRATVTFRVNRLHVRRVFRLYPGCPAIACDYYIRGKAVQSWVRLRSSVGDLGNIEDSSALRQGRFSAPTLERLAFSRRHLNVSCTRYFDITDWRNTLVLTDRIVPYERHPAYLTGNLLMAVDAFQDDALFVLKEAACSDIQHGYSGCDFLCNNSLILCVGIGADASDLAEDGWVRCDGFVTGLAEGGETGALNALRTYQGSARTYSPERDDMVLLNTWGDRSQDSRVNETFTLAELEAGARLGVTHFQIDDGWQLGRTSNSVLAGGSLENIWTRDDYWSVSPERFPNGLKPVVDRAKELGIELGLWFNPSRDNSYATWERDAETLIGLHREHGVRTFKIDGVQLPDRRAEVNLRAMLDRVLEATGNDVTFNLDVTAGRRFGYHTFNEYGNKFLENRYTDWGNYYPHWTLRNLWMLSRTVPPQGLQIEFLNKWRNADKYNDGDPLAPINVPFDYGFAVTMMAQPLAWFEATGLPEEAFEIAPLIRTYRQHVAAIHAGRIFPIGEEPCGTGWTGFQSYNGDRGYLLVYREFTERPSARLRLWDAPSGTLRCTAVAGHGESFEAAVDANGCVEFELPGPLTFALYEYRAG